MSSRRLFIGIELPFDLQNRIANELAPFRTREDRRMRIRWVRPDKLHFTLKFLGEIDSQSEESLIPQILRTMETVAAFHRASCVRLKSVGVFPHAQRPRVLWLDVEDSDSLLSRLASALEAALSRTLPAQGISGELRPFVPHLTVARLEGKLPSGALERLRNLEFGEFQIRELILFESVPSGYYAQLGRVSLATSLL